MKCQGEINGPTKATSQNNPSTKREKIVDDG
jgi:hypothetical protein